VRAAGPSALRPTQPFASSTSLGNLTVLRRRKRMKGVGVPGDENIIGKFDHGARSIGWLWFKDLLERKQNRRSLTWLYSIFLTERRKGAFQIRSTHKSLDSIVPLGCDGPFGRSREGGSIFLTVIK